jgi:hypothetical protein
MNDVSTNAPNVAAGLRTGAMTRNDGATDMRTARGFHIYCDTRGAAQRLGVSPRIGLPIARWWAQVGPHRARCPLSR